MSHKARKWQSWDQTFRQSDSGTQTAGNKVLLPLRAELEWGVWSEFCAQGPSWRFIAFLVHQCFLLGRDVMITLTWPSRCGSVTCLHADLVGSEQPVPRHRQDSCSILQVLGVPVSCSGPRCAVRWQRWGWSSPALQAPSAEHSPLRTPCH